METTWLRICPRITQINDKYNFIWNTLLLFPKIHIHFVPVKAMDFSVDQFVL